MKLKVLWCNSNFSGHCNPCIVKSSCDVLYFILPIKTLFLVLRNTAEKHEKEPRYKVPSKDWNKRHHVLFVVYLFFFRSQRNVMMIFQFSILCDNKNKECVPRAENTFVLFTLPTRRCQVVAMYERRRKNRHLLIECVLFELPSWRYHPRRSLFAFETVVVAPKLKGWRKRRPTVFRCLILHRENISRERPWLGSKTHPTTRAAHEMWVPSRFV